MKHFVLMQTRGSYESVEGVFRTKRAAIKSYNTYNHSIYHLPNVVIKVFENENHIKTIWLRREREIPIFKTRHKEPFAHELIRDIRSVEGKLNRDKSVK